MVVSRWFIISAIAGGLVFRMYKRHREIDLLARTLWGEARSEGPLGMQAVANVIMNRVEKGGWWGDSVETVILKEKQFSAWNEGDPNRALMEAVTVADPIFVEALGIATRAYDGHLLDITRGADHYNTTGVDPSWDDDMELTLLMGHHEFFRST